MIFLRLKSFLKLFYFLKFFKIILFLSNFNGCFIINKINMLILNYYFLKEEVCVDLKIFIGFYWFVGEKEVGGLMFFLVILIIKYCLISLNCIFIVLICV